MGSYALALRDWLFSLGIALPSLPSPERPAVLGPFLLPNALSLHMCHLPLLKSGVRAAGAAAGWPREHLSVKAVWDCFLSRAAWGRAWGCEPAAPTKGLRPPLGSALDLSAAVA